SCFADMLHDHDRNEKYFKGIRAAVSRIKARGERVVVLDIGTGTGLLSMMAVTAGADFCYAVEVRKNSRFAGCEAVPHRATVYAQLVESELLWRWAQLQPVEVEGARLVPPPAVGRCPGAHSVCKTGEACSAFLIFHLQFVFTPFCILSSVDFSKPVSSAFQSHSTSFVAQFGGRAQVVLSWWDLDMDPSGTIVCSMAPSWMYPQPTMAPSVYFLPVETQVAEQEELSLTVCHDDYSLLQDVRAKTPQSRPSCTCQAHLVWNRRRSGMLTLQTSFYIPNILAKILVLMSDFVLLFLIQVLEANSVKGGVELLEIRPEQLTSQDLGGEQVPLCLLRLLLPRRAKIIRWLEAQQCRS
ncbi:hypothetical protein XENOCAPTIV_029296, partial [Xenoophorus captivus]